MKEYTLIPILNKEKNSLLMCYRTCNPFKGRYNFVGGKIEANEEAELSAYRELQEETGISFNDVSLEELFTETGAYEDGQEWKLYIYLGKLNKNVSLIEEKHPLSWIPLELKDFHGEKYAESVGKIVDFIMKRVYL